MKACFEFAAIVSGRNDVATKLCPWLLDIATFATFALFFGSTTRVARTRRGVGQCQPNGLRLVIFLKGRKGRKGRKVYEASAQLSCDHFGCLRPMAAKH